MQINILSVGEESVLVFDLGGDHLSLALDSHYTPTLRNEPATTHLNIHKHIYSLTYLLKLTRTSTKIVESETAHSRLSKIFRMHVLGQHVWEESTCRLNILKKSRAGCVGA